MKINVSVPITSYNKVHILPHEAIYLRNNRALLMFCRAQMNLTHICGFRETVWESLHRFCKICLFDVSVHQTDVFQCSCGSVVEHCVSSAKGCGFDSQGTQILMKMHKPDSKKVGTLYKLWIKTECNDAMMQISIFYSEYNIDDISNV